MIENIKFLSLNYGYGLVNKKYPFFKSILMIIVLVVMSVVFTSCSPSVDNNYIQELNITKIAFETEINKYSVDVMDIASQLEDLYNTDNKDDIISIVDKSEYEMDESGVFYRPRYNENSSVFVSGFIPIDEKIKEIVYFTEPIELTFKNLIERSPEIAQVYYNDEYSYNRIYPGFDVLTQYEPKMNIPSFNFYYLADKEHNPDKQSVWVKAPYVDPAGRGWMISVIAPVYHEERLVGVPGIDLTISEITDKHLNDEDVVMITSDGMIVTISEKLTNLLSLPPLREHKYIETIKSDSYRIDDYNLLKSNSEDIRTAFEDVLGTEEDLLKINISGKDYYAYKVKIEKLDWYLIKLMPVR